MDSLHCRTIRSPLTWFHPPMIEHTILAADPEIGIEWPATDSMRMSARDREAPTLQHVREAGLLPAWASRRV